MAKLEIKNLHVKVVDKHILNGVDLTVSDGEVVALLGPNGHGKSTLLNAIMGNPNYVVTEGSIHFDGQDVLAMSVDERSRAGLFLGMQAPSEVPGVVNADFIRAALNARTDKPVSPIKLFRLIEKASKEMQMPLDLSNRNLNEGFSGGEKKRNEILQMKLLQPTLAMLDEIDSGLDVDGIKVIADQINNERKAERAFLIISHYARLYDLINPTRAIVMINGQIVVDGDVSVIQRIDSEGYEWLAREKGIKIEKETVKVTTLGSCAVKESI
ncbi:MAG TPA: Fe-S cluster assembly ATPase SufC [Bacilli bacterium]|nr:Fe-S cluster assembly ATPase SufC [Bacilli bacterium]